MINSVYQPQDHPDGGRSLPGIFVHAVLVVTATIFAAQSLARLRGQPRHVLLYQVVATAIIPTFALADTGIAICRTVKAWQRTRWDSPNRYYLCAAFDMRAISTTNNQKETKGVKKVDAIAEAEVRENEEITIPIHLIPSQNLECQSLPRNAQWYAHLTTLVALTAYAAINVIFWIRRAHYGARTFVDDYVALTALSGLLMGLLSICILVINTKWHAPDSYATKYQKYCSEPSLADLFMNLAWVTRLIELQVASVAAIFLESAVFFSSHYGFQRNVIHYGALCTPREMLEQAERRIHRPKATSHSLDFKSTTPRPCRTWSDGGISRLTALFADVGYIFAFVFALMPAFYLLRFALWCILRRKEDLSGRSNWANYLKIRGSGRTYAWFTFSLICIAVWEITSPEAWEPWMWKDPWVSRW